MIKKLKELEKTGEYNGYHQFKATFDDGYQCQLSDKDNPPKFISEGDTLELEEKWPVKGGPCKGLKVCSSKRVQGEIPPAFEAQHPPTKGGAAIGARIGCAFNNAVQLVVAEKLPFEKVEEATIQFVDMLERVEEYATNK